MEQKQNLLHLLTAEAIVSRRVHGSFAAFRSRIERTERSLPHATILMVLSHFGVGVEWLGFFAAFLHAPLRFTDEGGKTAPRRRLNGTPPSHSLSTVFSECILFCMDFAVNVRTSGSLLHRVADDLWFWSHGLPRVETAWACVQGFIQTMGLSIDAAKTGAIRIEQDFVQDTRTESRLPRDKIRWGMLYFDPFTLHFVIDQSTVDEHITELKKQLIAKKNGDGSVFAWIKVWNTYANTFASNFGKTANCFSDVHVEGILLTYKRIQKQVFDGQSAVQYLRAMLTRRFGVQNIPDGFFFFPIGLGGLQMQCPFIKPNSVRDELAVGLEQILGDFEFEEHMCYWKAEKRFDKLGSTRTAVPQANSQFSSDQEGASGPAGVRETEFLSFEDYIQHRETLCESDVGTSPIADAYQKLLHLHQPTERDVSVDTHLGEALKALPGGHGTEITCRWDDMSAYWKWVTALYGPEVLDKFRSLEIVNRDMLPVGVVEQARSSRVSWNG